MSVNAGNVVVAIKAVDECSSTFEKIQASMGVLGGTLSQLGGPFAGLGSIVSGFAAGGPAGAGIAALGQVTGFLTDSIAEAGKSEEAMTNLAAAVERGGTAWDTVKDDVEKALGSMQSMSKFSDEELAGALQTLVTHGMDTKTALESLHTAMDTAVGSGRDLQTVSEAIGKAYEGQEGPLARIVPAIKDMKDSMGEGATKAELFQGALGTLNERFSGAALADAETFAGTQERMANAWSDFQEQVGKALLPALTDILNGLLKVGNEGIGPLMDSLGELWSAITGDPDSKAALSGFIDGVIFILKGLASFIKDDLVPTIKLIRGAFQDASDAVSSIVDTIKTTVGGFVDWLKTTFQGFYDWLVGGSLWTDLWNNLNSIISGAAATIISSIGSSLFDPLKSGFTTTVDTLKTTFGGVVDAVSKPLSDITTKIHDEFPNMSSAITAGTDILKGDWSKGLKGLADAVPGAFAEVTTALSKALGDVGGQVNNWFAGAFKGLGQALSGVTGGKNPFAAVGDDAQNSVHGVSQAQQAMDAFGSSSNVATGYITDLANEMQSQPEIFSAWASNFQAAGVQIDTTKAKIGDYVQAAAKVTQAYQQGKIDEEHFANMLGELGDAFDVTKLKTQGFVDGITAILTAGSEAWYAPILNFVNLVIGHSLWPEAWDSIVKEVQTQSVALTAVVSDLFNTLNQIAQQGTEHIEDSFHKMLSTVLDSIQRLAGGITNGLNSIEADMDMFSTKWTSLNIALIATSIFDYLVSEIEVFSSAIKSGFTEAAALTLNFSTALQQLRSALDTAVIDDVTAAIKSLSAAINTDLAATVGTITAFTDKWHGLQETLKEGITTSITDVSTGLRTNIFEVLTSSIDRFTRSFNLFTDITAAIRSFVGEWQALQTLLMGGADVLFQATASSIKNFSLAFVEAIGAIIPAMSAFQVEWQNMTTSLTVSVLGVVSSAIQDLKNVIVDAFTTGITILSAFIAEWQNLQTTLMGSIPIFSLIEMQMTVFATSVQAALILIAAPLADLIGLVQAWSTSWSNLAATAQSSLALMKGQLKGFFDWLTPFWESSTAAFLGTATIWLETLNGQMRTRLNDMHSVWSSTLSSMAGDAASYFNSIVAQISAAVDRIIAKLSAARAQVSSHSIWPDMLNEMLTQTEDYMGQIEGAFAEGLQGGIVPTIAATGQQAPSAGFEEKTPLTPVTTTHDITLPIQIILDGEVLYTMIEKRQVQTIMQAARSKRG